MFNHKAVRTGGFHMDGYWVWDPSVIMAEDGLYHLFASRWPDTIPFHPGWLTNSEVIRAVSPNPQGPYEFQEVVITSRGNQYWDGRSIHNPRIQKVGNKFVLFYTGITSPLEPVKPGDTFTHNDSRCIVSRANKRVGMAVATSIYGPWKRFDNPILPTRPGKYDSYLTSNPSPVINEDGSCWLYYKSRKHVGETYGTMTGAIAKSDNVMGPYFVRGELVWNFHENDFEIEDFFVWKTKHGYEMFAKDMKGNICGEFCGGIHAESKDGISWSICKQPKAFSRQIQWDDDKIELFGSVERPFILFDKYAKPEYLFVAVADGPGCFQDIKKTRILVMKQDYATLAL